MRVLFTTTGHSGHLLPLVPLARACARAGHEVLVVTYASRAEAVERVDLPVQRIDDAPEEAWTDLMGRLPGLLQSEADAVIIGEGFARIAGGTALPAMLAAMEAAGPDLVVHEGYEFAGPVAAERLGLPTARVALGLASTEDWMEALSAAAVAGMRAEVGLPAGGDGQAHRGPLLSVVPPALDDGPAHRFRDVSPPPAPPLPAWWEADGRPLVYLTFGSVTGSLPFFPGLYRAALDALAPLPVRILLTIGRDADLEALGPPPPNAHVEAWLHQDAVLPHAAVVVSHGGYGTTLGAFAHGVPLVLLPLFAGDQWRNARRVAELGAGVILEHGERRVFDPPGPAVLAELPAAVQHVLGGRRFAQAADRIGRSMATVPTADATVAVLRATAAPGGLAR